jgi:hypothetical protein
LGDVERFGGAAEVATPSHLEKGLNLRKHGVPGYQ